MLQAVDPRYFDALVAWKGDLLATRPDLKEAFEKEGLLQALVAKRPELQRQRAEQILLRAQDEKRDKLEGRDHPEVRKLRALQQVEASEVLHGAAKIDAVAQLSQKRPTSGAARANDPASRLPQFYCLIVLSAALSLTKKRHAHTSIFKAMAFLHRR